MVGLKRDAVILESHDKNWKLLAYDSIETLNNIFKKAAIDIQHIGSTAIHNIRAKPIIDIVVGVNHLDNVNHFINSLKKENIIFRGQDVSNQFLFVIGDPTQDIRTHHIHIVLYNGKDWNNYINFRDYLNAYPSKAKEYEHFKLDLASTFHSNRIAYTNGKNTIIGKLLEEAAEWKSSNLSE